MYEHLRIMVFMLALNFDAPGLLNSLDPEYPERKAELCQKLFQLEIAALRGLIKASVRRVQRRTHTEEQAVAKGMRVMRKLQRQFVGDRSVPHYDQ
jgi:hypothetical protein